MSTHPEGGDFRMIDQSDGVALMAVKMSDFVRVLEPDQHSEPDWLTMDTGDTEVNAQNAEQLKAFNRGDWHLMGLYVRTEIYVPLGDKTAVAVTLTSPGLWGIESDADALYLDDVHADECKTLKAICETLGISVESDP
jgi:hypothetical protein